MDENSFSFTIYMIHACSNRWNVAPSRVYQALKKERLSGPVPDSML